MKNRKTDSTATDFKKVFGRLREMLRKRVGKLTVTKDLPTEYLLSGGCHPKHQRPMPLIWLKTGKNYVSFHHLAVYACPQLLEGASKELKARRQGKGCFNFKTVDEALFAELDDLVARAQKLMASDKLKFPGPSNKRD